MALRLPPPAGWTCFSDLRAERSGYYDADALASWVTDFLCRPLAGYPSEQAVCPGLRASIEVGLFFVMSHPIAEPKPSALFIAVLRERLAYKRYQQQLPEALRGLLGLFIALPHWPASAYRRLDRVQERLMPIFAADDLSVREFSPVNDDRSLRQSDVTIGRAPVCGFAIRSLLPHDGEAWEAHRH